MVTQRPPRRRAWGADHDPVVAAVGIAYAYVGAARRRVAHARRDETDLARLARDVHEARKALKRARAHLALVAPLVDRRDAQDLARRCRDVGRALAPARDATIVVEAFEAVLASVPDPIATDTPPSSVLETLRSLLAVERDEALRALCDGPALGAARHALRTLEHDVASLQEAVRRGGPKAWARGVERMHGRARQAALRASAASDDGERAHRARQRWKAMGHVLRAFESAWPAQIAPLADAIEDVCECIGDHHDTLVLVERMRQVPGGAMSEAATWVAVNARLRADALLERAHPLLQRLAAERSDAFAARHRGYLRAALRETRSARVGVPAPDAAPLL